MTVTVARASGGSTDVTLDTNAGTAGDQDTLTFTTTNWNTTQTVTVSAARDSDTTNDTATLTHSAAGGGYGSVTASVAVTVTDDDTAPMPMPMAPATLVSNLGQTADTSTPGTPGVSNPNQFFDYEVAQAFTTGGDHAQGYTLSAVVADLAGVDSGARPEVGIYTALSDDTAGTLVHRLTNPASLGAGQRTWTAPANATLARNTKYFVVFGNARGAAEYRLRSTSSDNDDAGAASGWSIADHRRHYDGAFWSTNTRPLKIGISGTSGAVAVSSAPALSTAAVDGAALVLTWDEALDTDSVPAADAFTVEVNDAERTVSNVAIAGRAVTLTLAPAVAHGDTVTLDYAVPSSNPIQDEAGNDAPALNDQAVTNNTPDTTAPALSAATVNGATLTLTYDEALDGTSVPGAGAFTVEVDDAAVFLAATNAVAVAGRAVTLTLASAVSAGDTVTVSYDVPTGMDANPIRDAAENNSAGLTDEAVANHTPGGAAVGVLADRGRRRHGDLHGAAEHPADRQRGGDGCRRQHGRDVRHQRRLERHTGDADLRAGRLEHGEDRDGEGGPGRRQNDDSATLTHTASGGGYGGLTASLAVTVTDADRAATTTPTAGLVSNLGQTAAGTVNLSSHGHRRAQQFTTGPNADGYTLSTVTANVQVLSGAAVRAYIYSASGSDPDTRLFALSNPASFDGVGNDTWRAPASAPALTADTGYFVVFERMGSNFIRIGQTDSTGNEDMGGAAGWSIADAHRELGGGRMVIGVRRIADRGQRRGGARAGHARPRR